jgi:hypothetical protein
MDARNERAPVRRGAGELFSHLDCGADSITPRRCEIFGAMVVVHEHTTSCEPCPQCGATIAMPGPGTALTSPRCGVCADIILGGCRSPGGWHDHKL